MLTEHAITFEDKISAQQLDYLVKKANRIGLNQRSVVRVYTQEDSEGKHLYFETSTRIKNDSFT